VFDQQGLRSSVHIKEGVGILITQENMPLIPQNVILAIPWHFLMFGNLTINVQENIEEEYEEYEWEG
jgi:hypothetical protein